MSVKMEKIENNTAKLEISVPAADFKKAVDKSYHKNVQKFNIPGFRKGKAPKVIIEQMYGEEVFYEDAINMVIDDTYPQALDDNNLKPVDKPEINFSQLEKDKDFIYTASVTVRPEATLGEYKGLEVEKKEYTVNDEDIQKQLDAMQEKNARIITKEEGTIEKGDTAIIDFEGFVDGAAFEGGKGENYSLEIGSGSFIDGFEEQLIGKKSGEETEVNVKFPDEYGAKELAGKDAMFKVKINEIKAKELVPLDDEFAKDVSEFETLDELKEDLKKKTEENNTLRAKNEFEESVINKAVENAEVDIPDVMVDRQINYMLDDINYKLQYQGLTLDQYAGFMNTTVDKMKEDYRDAAYKRVKTELVLAKVAEVESIEASEEDVDKELENIAKQYNQDIAKIKETIKDTSFIKDGIITRKAAEYLVDNATPVAAKDNDKK
jgi:trigger factor